MTQGRGSTKTPRSGTKERIIEAAFSFYSDFVFGDVSLSKIAAPVGISKPAIFKHFKTKDSLVAAMDNRVFSHLTGVLQEMELLFRAGKRGDALAHIIGYLAKNREETYYLVSTVPRITADAVFQQLRKRGVNLFDGIFNADGSVKDLGLYYLTVYASSTFLCFLMFWFSTADSREPEAGAISCFTAKFNILFQDGLDGLAEIAAPAVIEERCLAGLSSAKAMNRAFAALAAVVEEKGLGGVTVEAIAGRLGLAKSSLYSSFRSKEEMLVVLIDEELANLYSAVLSCMEGLSCYGERIYALMRTSMHYFLIRPEIITIFQSIVLSGRNPDGGLEAERECGCDTASGRLQEAILERLSFPSLPDVGIGGFCGQMLLSWFFAVPAMLYLHCRVHGCSDEEMLQAVGMMYRFMEGGLSGFSSSGAESRVSASSAQITEKDDGRPAIMGQDGMEQDWELCHGDETHERK